MKDLEKAYAGCKNWGDFLKLCRKSNAVHLPYSSRTIAGGMLLGFETKELIAFYLAMEDMSELRLLRQREDTDEYIVGLDVSENQQHAFVIVQFDDFPTVIYIDQTLEMTEFESNDLIDFLCSKPRFGVMESDFLFTIDYEFDQDEPALLQQIEVDLKERRAY